MKRLRKPLLALHTWLGLTAGVVLLIVALTGAMLLFRSSLERRLDPQRFVVAPGTNRVSIDALVAEARAAHPAGEVESIRFYGDPSAPFLVLFSNKEYVHLNPWTGAVLGIRQRYREGFGWIEGLHKYLTLEPSLGENVNGSFAFVFAGMVMIGLALWWPATRRALKAGLTLNPRLKGRPWHLHLHKTLGAYAGLIILFNALTGIPIALDSTRAVLYALTGSRKDAPVTSPGQPGFAGFAAAARQIDALMPAARETYIARAKMGVIASYAIAADAPHPNARSYVWMDGPSSRVLRWTPYATASRGFRVYYWLLSLHTGMTGGPVWWVALLLGTLSVPVLAYTGVASYSRRRQRRENVGAAPAVVTEAGDADPVAPAVR